MNQNIQQLSLVIDDYDKAIEYYSGILNFELVEDSKISDTKRWVVVKPKGNGEFTLLLAKATNEEQKSRVGNQTGGRVFLFIHTDNIDRDFLVLKQSNVKIVREPSVETYGKVLVFEDIYGNLWDLIQPANLTSKKVYVHTLFRAIEGADMDSVINGLEIFQEVSRELDGTLSFEIHQSISKRDVFVLLASFESAEVYQKHLLSDYRKAFERRGIVKLLGTQVS